MTREDDQTGRLDAGMHQSHFQVMARRHELQSVAAKVEAFCAANAIPAAISNRMNLALDEVLSNIVKYAYDTSENEIIDVELTYSNNGFMATVQDAGKPFNPLLFPRPDTSGPLKDRRPGGLGILFVRSLMDSVAYERRSDRNRLTLIVGAPFA